MDNEFQLRKKEIRELVLREKIVKVINEKEEEYAINLYRELGYPEEDSGLMVDSVFRNEEIKGYPKSIIIDALKYRLKRFLEEMDGYGVIITDDDLIDERLELLKLDVSYILEDLIQKNKWNK